MPNMSGPKVAAHPGFSSSATPKHAIGERFETGDGRIFRYVKAGAVALVVGNALQSRVEDVDHDNIAVRATEAGSTDLLITAGASGGALDANEYAGGWAVIDTAGGSPVGYTYKISGHDAIAALANGVIRLVKEDAVQVALTTAAKVTLIANPWDGVIQHPVTTASGYCVGGAIYPIPAGEYGWIQSGGPGAGLIAGTPGPGLPVTSVGAVPGALTVHSAELGTVAKMMVTGRNTNVCPVYWLVDS